MGNPTFFNAGTRSMEVRLPVVIHCCCCLWLLLLLLLLRLLPPLAGLPPPPTPPTPPPVLLAEDRRGPLPPVLMESWESPLVVGDFKAAIEEEGEVGDEGEKLAERREDRRLPVGEESRRLISLSMIRTDGRMDG